MRAYLLLLRACSLLPLALLMPLAFSSKVSSDDTKRTSILAQPPLQINQYLRPLILPQLNRSSSQSASWSSSDRLGQNALLLLLLGSSPKPQSQIAWLKSVQQAPRQMQGNAAEVVIVLSRPESIEMGAQKTLQPSFTVLLDTKGHLSQAFKVPPQGVVIVTVDRAGFIRRSERFPKLPSAALLKTRLQGLKELAPPLAVGKPAPDFILRDMKGHLRRLSTLKGKKHLLLTFFPRCFTGGCTQQVVSLQKELPALLATDTEVWAVSVDPAEGPRGQRAFAARWGLQFPLLPDVGRNLSILYGAANSPNQLSSRMSVLIDKEGVVRWIDKQINVRTHGEDVLRKLRELGMLGMEEPKMEQREQKAQLPRLR